MNTTQTPLAHHTFAPWSVDGDRRIVAAKREWQEPLKWNRDAESAGERRRVMVSVDVFEDWVCRMRDGDGYPLEKSIITDFEWRPNMKEFGPDDSISLKMRDVRDRLFQLIDSTPNLDWVIETNYPDNIEKMMPCRAISEHHLDRCDGGRVQSPNAQFTRDCTACKGTGVRFNSNLWLGVRVSNQAEADSRIPQLLRVPAAVRFAMCELTGAVDFSRWLNNSIVTGHPAWKNDTNRPSVADPMLHWFIVSGESGPDARPMHPDWVRGVRDQCQAAGVPFWFDGWGDWLPWRAEHMNVSHYDFASSPLRRFSKLTGFINETREFSTRQEVDKFLYDECVNVIRVGKERSGRLLDGREWNELPNQQQGD